MPNVETNNVTNPNATVPSDSQIPMRTPPPVNASPIDAPITNQVKPTYQEQMEDTSDINNQVNNKRGDSGTSRFGGYFFNEYNEKFEHREKYIVIELMRRGDGYIKAALKAIKGPLLGTKWMITTAGTKPKDQEIKEFVEKMIFKQMRRTWKEFLREALCYLDFGYYVFEFIWEKRDGKIVLADLEPRIPRSILNWRIADGKFGITQILQTDEANITLPQTPASKLFILTNEKEGDDVEGQSVLRAAFKHFDMKEILYKVQVIGFERFGAGIPIVEPAPGAGPADKAAAIQLGQEMRTNENGYIYRPPGWKTDMLGNGAGGHSAHSPIDDAITHHGQMILMSVLATFLALGTDGTGSYALSQDQSSFFLKSLEDMATYFCEQFNAQIIKKIVKINFGEQECYPELTFAPLGDLNFKDLSYSLSTLAQAGLLNANDPRIMQYIHNAFKLPEITDEDLEMMKEKKLENDLSSLDTEHNKEPEEPPPDTQGEDGNSHGASAEDIE